jgi:hypothetical protein
MDRGIPTEEVLTEMRDPPRQLFYLVGTPRGKIRKWEKKWLALSWQKVRDSVEVKLLVEDGELYVLAKSEGRRAKEMAIRRKKLARVLWKLRAMRHSCPPRDRIGIAAGGAENVVKTLAMPPLKRKHLAVAYAPNCESRVSVPLKERAVCRKTTSELYFFCSE